MTGLAVLAPSHVAMAEASTPQPAQYTVAEGDFLSKIAEQYHVTWQRLFDKNTDIANPDLIHPGEVIQVPAEAEQLAHREVVAAPVAAPAAPEPVAPAPEPAAAPQPAPAPVQEAVATTPAPAPAPASGCGDNEMAHYIYMHESSCNPNARNAQGCYGIGQDCNGAVEKECGADYACQNAFFTRYANSRYGGWQGAYDFWLAHNWW